MGVPAQHEGELVFPDQGCFGCSATNPAGLHLRFFKQGDSVIGAPTLPAHYAGWPGVAHGGIVTTLLDEYSCAAAYALKGALVLTGEMDVRFVAPCPVGVELETEAHVVDASHARYLEVEAQVRHAGSVVAISSGRFFRVSDDHETPD